MHTPRLAVLLPAAVFAAVLAALTGCHSADPPATQPGADADAGVPLDAADVSPLGPGDAAPTGDVRTPDGKTVALADLYDERPTVLVFYRGGWCPYCNTHLGQLAKAEPKLVKMGYQVVAISPDRPEKVRATVDEGGFEYQIVSDSDMSIARAFGLAFRVDDATIEKYKTYEIDLEDASGEGHQLLPVPAVYIVDTSGTIRFVHYDPDYKQRLEADPLLAAARDAAS